MLLLLLLWLAVLPAVLVSGSAIVVRVAGHDRVPLADRLLLSCWVGLLLVANLLLGLSLLVPLTPLAGAAALAAVALGALAAGGVRRQARSAASAAGAGAGVAVLAVLAGAAAIGAKPVTWYDTGLYHYGAIRWLAEHGAVPGHALIHSRFAIVSSWFAAAAPFDAGPVKARLATVASGLAVALAGLHLVRAAARLVAGRGRPSDAFAAAALSVVLPLVAWMGASASPDLPVTVLTVLVPWCILLAHEPGEGERSTEGRAAGGLVGVALALGAGAVTLKLSALPLLGVAALAFAWWSAGRGRTLACGVAAVACALLPVAAAGLVISGCAFFPARLFCVEGPTSVGADEAGRNAAIMRDWARWDGPTPTGAAGWDWVLPWVGRHPLTAAIVLVAVAAALALVSPRRRARVPGADWVALLGAGGLAFVLLTAPAPRFVTASAAVLPALWLATTRAVPRRPRRVPLPWLGVGVGGLLIAAAAALTLGSVTLRGRADAAQLLIPPPMPVPEGLVARRAADFGYRSPAPPDDRCWAAPLPCTPYLAAPGVSLLDPARGLRGGFRRTP